VDGLADRRAGSPRAWAELRVEVPGARLDEAVLGEPEPALRGVEGPLVVDPAAGVVVGDARDRPGVDDLLGPVRVAAQHPAADGRRHPGCAGGGEVDDDVQRRRVPALAEQPARADDDTGAAGLEPVLHQGDPRRRGPLVPGGQAHERAVARVRLGDQPVGEAVGCAGAEVGEVLPPQGDGPPVHSTGAARTPPRSSPARRRPRRRTRAQEPRPPGGSARRARRLGRRRSRRPRATAGRCGARRARRPARAGRRRPWRPTPRRPGRTPTSSRAGRVR
jgi:hypothetical protein